MSENPIDAAKKFQQQRARYRLVIGVAAAAIILGSTLQMALSGSVAPPMERVPFLIGTIVACFCLCAAPQELKCPACADFPGRGDFCGSCGVQLNDNGRERQPTGL
jgi:hypothetical protein